MKKNSVKGYISLGILFVLITVIAFAVPTEKTGAFWVAYLFTAAAIAAQIAVWKTAFGAEQTLKSKFLGLPVVHIGAVYLVVQLIVFAVFLFVPALPVWSAVVVCAVIAAVSALCMIGGQAGRGEIERVEQKTRQKTFYIRSLQADIELLARAETDEALRAKLTQLAEKIRFSDPMSSDALAGLEEQIAQRAEALKTAADKAPLIDELFSLVDERNIKCKLLK